jgi:CRISPR/Cas system CSM-associated protein Csm3 (group 7 of RAMP superfamily)
MNHLIITGTLTPRTALHIGSGESSEVVDSVLRRNAAGQLFVPGSTVAGALRTLATRLAPRLEGGGTCKALEPPGAEEEGAGSGLKKAACGCATCHLFGDVNPQKENVEEKGGRAARLWVYDAKYVTPSATAVRDGVGIDRRTRTAARQEAAKFDTEVLTAGSAFRLRLELEDANEMDQRLLAAALAEWAAGRGLMGGRVARGLGAFALKDLKCQARSLGEPAALMGFLRGKEQAGLTVLDTWLTDHLAQARASLQAGDDDAPSIARGWVELELTLQATGPFLVNDPGMAGKTGFDHTPLIEGRPILPGSGVRGALRSHAERTARTLATAAAGNEDAFLSACPACSPLARPSHTRPTAPLQACDTLLDALPEEQRKRITDQGSEEANLCLACRLFGSTWLGSRLLIEDAPLQKGTKPAYKVQDFLAIDRFTGGGRDGAKFDTVALWKPAFTGRLRLENPAAWELGWLALVLRDLVEGWLSLGFGRAKGFGQVTVPRWTARLGFLLPEDLPVRADLLAAVPSGESLYHVLTLQGDGTASDGQPAWRLDGERDAEGWRAQVADWIEAFRQQVRGFDRHDLVLPRIPLDNYFGRQIAGIPMEDVYRKPEEVEAHG